MATMSRTIRHRTSNKWIKYTGLAIGVVSGIAAAVYYNRSLRSNSGDSKEQKSSETLSKCIVVTNSFCETKKIDWADLLSQDVVLLVTPGQTLNEVKGATTYGYKIIYCETMTGVWSCLKHLQKDIVILKSSELEDAVPLDIARYAKEVIDLSSAVDPESLFLDYL